MISNTSCCSCRRTERSITIMVRAFYQNNMLFLMKRIESNRIESNSRECVRSGSIRGVRGFNDRTSPPLPSGESMFYQVRTPTPTQTHNQPYAFFFSLSHSLSLFVPRYLLCVCVCVCVAHPSVER
jgi:hypothetical protein